MRDSGDDGRRILHLPDDCVAVAAAPVPPPPEKAMVGAEVQPNPWKWEV